MSFSSILSNNEPVNKSAKSEKPKEKSPTAPIDSDAEPSANKGIRVLKLNQSDDKKARAPRRIAKPRVSSARSKDTDKEDSILSETPAKTSRRVSTKLSTPDVRAPAKRGPNGQQKKRPSVSTEKGVQTFLKTLDDTTEDFDPEEYFETSEYEEEQLAWKDRQRRHKSSMLNREAYLGSSRRSDLSETLAKRLGEHSSLGSKRFYEIYYDGALQEVREQELFAEKERKKDMQRKRRREKSMAVTLEQKKTADRKSVV